MYDLTLICLHVNKNLVPASTTTLDSRSPRPPGTLRPPAGRICQQTGGEDGEAAWGREGVRVAGFWFQHVARAERSGRALRVGVTGAPGHNAARRILKDW